MPIGGSREALKYIRWLLSHPEYTEEEHLTFLQALIDDPENSLKQEKRMSLGEDRVRIKFNPSANSDVDRLKHMTAEIIDLCEVMRSKGSADGEHQRLWALAMSYYENAAMWAVKAATF